MILQLMILEYQNLQLIWMRVLNKKKMCFLKLIDKERDFEHLKKISVVDIKSDSQIEKLSDRIIWTLEN